MNEIKVIDRTNILGHEIQVIEGGFGEGQKVILAKTIAEIHEIEISKVNELINNNMEEFEVGIDVVDLKNDKNFAIVSKDNGIYSQNSLNASKHIYLLSEQGYMLLVGFMRTEKAKEIRKKLRREYFSMRKELKEVKNEKEELLLQLFSNDPLTIANAHKKLVEIETKPLLDKIEEDKPLVGFAETCIKSSESILVRELAKLATDEGIKIGQNKLYEKLREWNYILKSNTEPTQYAMDRDYFEVIQGTTETPYGAKTWRTSKVKPKGQIQIIERLKKEFCNE